MRLGLFGGRFDPPHLGHLLAAQEAAEELELHELWFIPAQCPPHKAAMTAAEHRFNMTLLATASHPGFRVSRLEIERGGPSYSFDTVSHIKGQRPQVELFFITGADAYEQIASWHRARELVETAQMIAVSRPGYTWNGMEAFYREKVRLLRSPSVDISSTDIRRRLAQRRPVRYLVPEHVENYLVKHHLYHQ